MLSMSYRKFLLNLWHEHTRQRWINLWRKTIDDDKMFQDFYLLNWFDYFFFILSNNRHIRWPVENEKRSEVYNQPSDSGRFLCHKITCNFNSCTHCNCNGGICDSHILSSSTKVSDQNVLTVVGLIRSFFLLTILMIILFVFFPLCFFSCTGQPQDSPANISDAGALKAGIFQLASSKSSKPTTSKPTITSDDSNSRPFKLIEGWSPTFYT